MGQERRLEVPEEFKGLSHPSIFPSLTFSYSQSSVTGREGQLLDTPSNGLDRLKVITIPHPTCPRKLPPQFALLNPLNPASLLCVNCSEGRNGWKRRGNLIGRLPDGGDDDDGGGGDDGGSRHQG